MGEAVSRLLNDLDPRLYSKACELIARCVERGIEPVIIDVLRTDAEHAANVAAGVSWTKRSRHLPNAHGKSEAIDLAPRICLGMKNWAPDHPYWLVIRDEAERLGLVSGARWAKRDMGHVQLP